MMKSQQLPVGLAKGPGPSPHSFTFISNDNEQRLKIGEFVTYQVKMDSGEERVLARVTERRPLRLYPNSFLADPNTSPASVTSTLGYNGENAELFEIIAEVIGYFDLELRDFINPRIAPKGGSVIFLAEDDFLSSVLSRRSKGEVGAAEVGWLLSRKKGEVPIAVDLEAYCSTHLAIIASTGAGKSYLASVLIEEMLKPNNRAAVLVVDPHGEYDTLDDMKGNKEFRHMDGYRPEVEIKKPGSVKVRYGSLSLGDLRYLLPDLSDRMEYVLRLAHQRVEKQSRREHAGYPDRWTLGNLQNVLREIGHQADPEDSNSEPTENGSGKYKDTADAVLWRIGVALERTVIFDNSVQTNLRDVVKPGCCTVLQLNEVDSRQQQVMIAILLRKLFEARMKTVKGEVSGTEETENYLPYPVFVLVEEAHHFAPANARVVSAGILKQILAEGRKFGMGVGLISQRPGKLDADVLSQCNTQFLLRIVNPIDQARVRESVESVGQDLIDELPALSKGQAIVAGAAVNTPVLCQIRPRITPHGAEDISAPKEWTGYFSQLKQDQLKREDARLERTPPSSLQYKS